MVVVVRTDEEAHRLADDLAAWLPSGQVRVLPERAALPLERALPEHDESAERLEVLDLLAGRHHGLVVVAPLLALVQRTLSPAQLAAGRVALKVGERVEQRALLTALVHGGYEAAVEVSGVGEFANRGGIIDIWPPGATEPLRLELFGDEVESMRAFDPMTQGSRRRVERATLLPASEFLPADGWETLARPRAGAPLGRAAGRPGATRAGRRGGGGRDVGGAAHRRAGRGPPAGGRARRPDRRRRAARHRRRPRRAGHGASRRPGGERRAAAGLAAPVRRRRHARGPRGPRRRAARRGRRGRRRLRPRPAAPRAIGPARGVARRAGIEPAAGGDHRPGEPRRRAARGGGPRRRPHRRAARAPAARRHRPRPWLALGRLQPRADQPAGAHRPGAVRRDPRAAADPVEAGRDARPDRAARGRRRGGAHRPRHRALRGDDPARVRRRDEGVPPARLRRRRQDLPAGRPDRAHHALFRRPGADPLAPGRHRLGAHQEPRPPRGAGAGRGPAGDLRRPRIGPRLLLLARHDLAARAGRGVPLHRDEGPAAHDRGGQGRHAPPPPDGPPRLRRRRLRQDRGRPARRLQGGAGRQAGGGARPDHGPGAAAPRHVPAPPGALPGAGRDAEPLRRQAGAGADRGGHRRGEGRHPDRDASDPEQGHRLRRPGAAGGRRGAALRGRAQGADQGDAPRGRRADPLRHADPAHAAPVAGRHPRPVA